MPVDLTTIPSSRSRSAPWTASLLKGLIVVHRWMGVGFSALFLAWFLSGFVMMYRSFPSVDTGERLARAAALEPAQVRVSPEAALAALQTPAKPDQVRLNMLDGRPVYRFGFGRRTQLVFADNGERLDAISQAMALRVAAAWTGFPAASAVAHPLLTRNDQWTVYSSVHPYAPFWKFSWSNGEEVYVSQTTGEVVQDTTRGARLAAYCGAIPHWLYFTRLRADAPLWSAVVIWLSGVGTVATILGLVMGIWLYSPRKRYRARGSNSRLPYAGNKHWHVLLGLLFGAVTCTWVFSGYLSMDPIPWLSEQQAPNLARALQGGRLALPAFAAKPPQEALAQAAAAIQVKELDLIRFDGAPYYLALETEKNSRIVPLQGAPQPVFPTERILAAAARGASPAAIASTRMVRQYEAYYVDRHYQKPLPVLFLQLNDAGHSMYYIDPKTGRVAQSYGPHARWNRWLYHGLHSMDLPWLYARRPAWDIVVILLLLGGTVLSAHSLLLVGDVFRRKFFAFRKGDLS